MTKSFISDLKQTIKPEKLEELLDDVRNLERRFVYNLLLIYDKHHIREIIERNNIKLPWEWYEHYKSSISDERTSGDDDEIEPPPQDYDKSTLENVVDTLEEIKELQEEIEDSQKEEDKNGK